MTPLPDPARGRPIHVVVMGVSGTGKSTIAAALNERLGWPMAEGDEFHPQANVDKMASGRPLVDEDRWPWLQTLAEWIAARDAEGSNSIMTCSALRHTYRDILRRGGSGVYFLHLVGDKSTLLERMETREHFMPSSLLESQLDTLEPLSEAERGALIDVANPPERIARMAIAQLDLDR